MLGPDQDRTGASAADSSRKGSGRQGALIGPAWIQLKHDARRSDISPTQCLGSIGLPRTQVSPAMTYDGAAAERPARKLCLP
jgi:hypothetical protein